MSSHLSPPVPGQRKVKLVTGVKTTLAEQTAKLQSKHESEQDLLEDIRNYAKQRASVEKDYAQSVLKITSQLLSKLNGSVKIQQSTGNDDSSCNTEQTDDEDLRTPKGLWKKILLETEIMANTRLKISQTLQNDVVDSIKNLKIERASTLKKCTALAEKLQEEVTVSTSDLVKAQKTYTELQKLTNQARQTATDAQEKLSSGKVSILSSKAKLEKNVSKSHERKDASEKRSTTARNDYLLNLAAINAHQRKYYSQDLPDLIASQDGKIYEDLKNYFSIVTAIEKDAAHEFTNSMSNLEGYISLLERAYVIMCFLQEHAIFTKCEPYEFIGVVGDEISKITDEFGAGLTLNKEARKWTLRLAREQKAISTKTKKLKGLKAMSLVDMNLNALNDGTGSDTAKTTEQSIEVLAEEIRHLEVLKAKAEGRVEALKLAGVNVDEWLQQGAVSEPEDEENDTCLNSNQVIDDDFMDDEWDDSAPNYHYDNYSDDGLSVSSSAEPKNNTTQAVVLYPFEATSQEELTINVGEELELLETENDGWCRTRNKLGEVGFVPETYLEVKYSMTSDDADSLSRLSSHASSSCISEIQLEYNSATSLNIQDADVTPTPLSMGYHGVQTSITPSAMDCQKPDPHANIICYARAIYDYDAIEEEELSFQEGEVIKIVSKIVDDDDGWWEGIVNGRNGVFPCLLVEEMEQSDLPLHENGSLSQNSYFSNQAEISRSHSISSNGGFNSLLSRDNHT